MEPGLWLAVGLGGAFGAVLRGLVYRRLFLPLAEPGEGLWPGLGQTRSTLLVNGLGSLLLGLGIGWTNGPGPADPLGLALLTGVCGSLTTFSTFCADAIQLGRLRESRPLWVYLLAQAGGCVAAFAIGLRLSG